MIEADLRDDARRQHVALEHLGIAAEARDALLDACTAAESLRPMTGAPTFIADVHDLADLLRVPLGQRAAETR